MLPKIKVLTVAALLSFNGGVVDTVSFLGLSGLLTGSASQGKTTTMTALAGVRFGAAGGVSELVLISQDTTRYGEDLGLARRGLARLVERLLAETSFPWIRFLYAYPKTLDDSVLDLAS